MQDSPTIGFNQKNNSKGYEVLSLFIGCHDSGM
jgi:hypothetical protein